MKSALMKISALLLSVWYCFCIIGFDIHTCKGSGGTFVATIIGGLDCKDIHPEHTCLHGRCNAVSGDHCCDSHGDHCCGSHARTVGPSIDGQSCCTDDMQFLALSGFRSDDERNSTVHDDGCLLYAGTHHAYPVCPVSCRDHVLSGRCDDTCLRDISLPFLRVWRI